MEDRNGETHVETDSARGGSTPNIVRWVLGASLLAAIVLLSIVWMTGAATHDGDGPTASDRIEEQATAGSDTDGLVGERADEFESGGSPENGSPPRVENQSAQ